MTTTVELNNLRLHEGAQSVLIIDALLLTPAQRRHYTTESAALRYISNRFANVDPFSHSVADLRKWGYRGRTYIAGIKRKQAPKVVNL